MNRRELLAAAAAVLAGANTPEPLGRLLDGLTSAEAAGRVGRSEVEAVWHAATVYTTMGLRYGGAVAADMSSGALRWAVGLLDSPMRDATRVELSAAVAVLANRTAWSHFDAGQTYSARRLSTLAVRTADACTHPNLHAYVVQVMAKQIGDVLPAEAVSLVEPALADDRVCRLQRASLHGELAEYLAKIGEMRQARQHITKAEALAERGGETPPWLSFLTAEHLDSIITRSLACVGEDGEAINRYENLIPRMGPDRLRGRTGRTIDLANLYIDTGRMDEARALADQADTALTDIRSTRVTTALTNLRQRLPTGGRSR